MKIYTIGFTKKMAEQFFGLLWESGAEWLVAEHLQRHWDAVEIKHLRGGRFVLHSNSASPIRRASNLVTKISVPSLRNREINFSERENSFFVKGML